MRKIESLIVEAFRSDRAFTGGNTEVQPGRTVYLHGNRIVNCGAVDVDTLRTYPTNTTMSRLRALGFNVCRKDRRPYLDGRPV